MSRFITLCTMQNFLSLHLVYVVHHTICDVGDLAHNSLEWSQYFTPAHNALECTTPCYMKNTAYNIQCTSYDMLQLYPANQKPYIFCTIPCNFSLHNFNPHHTPEHGSIFPPICHQLLLSQSTTFGTSTPTHLQKVLDYIWHNNYTTFSTPNAWIGQSIYSTSPPIYLSQIAFVTIHLIWRNYSNTLAYYITGTTSSAPC